MRGLLLGCLVSVVATQCFAADKLAPDAIKTTFFNGQEFTAATPSGLKFKMVFTVDGKVTRTPAGNYGAKGEGSWKLFKDGFCTTWKRDKQHCYTLVTAGDNKWSVMQGPSMKAAWSK